MSHVLDDAQERLRLVRDSAAAVVPKDAGLARARALRFREPGFDRGLWTQMCALGWAGLRVPEDQGGSGLDVASLCAIARELGAALAPEPFVAVAAAARHLEADLAGPVLAGERIVVPAWLERPHDLGLPALQARLRNGRVSGTKRLVGGGAGAHAFVVVTRDGLAYVERDAAGVELTPVGLHDGSTAADVSFRDAPARALASSFESTLEECSLATSAFLLGAMESAFGMALDYLTVRTQFGKPIGSFQALQHRAVDMKIQIELTRAVVDEAVSALDGAGAPAAARKSLVSRAKMRAADAAMHVCKEAVQFHGAVGMTDECNVGLYLRKVLAVHNDWGSVVAHRQRFTSIEQATHD